MSKDEQTRRGFLENGISGVVVAIFTVGEALELLKKAFPLDPRYFLSETESKENALYFEQAFFRKTGIKIKLEDVLGWVWVYYPHRKVIDEMMEEDEKIRTIMGDVKDIYYPPILNMNAEHDSSNSKRIANLKFIKTPDLLFRIMAYHGRKAYLSTFQLMFSGLDQKNTNTFLNLVRKEGGMTKFLMEGDFEPKYFFEFLFLLAQHNVLKEFFKSLGKDDAEKTENFKNILNKFLEQLTPGVEEDVLVSLSDFSRVKGEDASKKVLLDVLKNLIDNPKVSEKFRLLAEIIIAQNAIADNSQGQIEEKLKDKYKKDLVSESKIEGKRLFEVQADGTLLNKQIYLFPNDKGSVVNDGELSFDNFRKTVAASGGQIRTKVEKVNGQTFKYIEVTKMQNGKKIVIHANSPEMSNDAVVAFHKWQMANFKPHMFVHRGHSFHAEGMSIPVLASPESKANQNLVSVNFGSCGGNKLTMAVLEILPQIAAPLGTRDVGKMLINDIILREIENQILAGEIDWQKVKVNSRKKVEQSGEPGGLSSFDEYIFPHENISVMVLRTYKKYSRNL